MPSQCFHEGDFWYATSATIAGQSPATHPDIWQRITIPMEWRRLLAKLMTARILRAEGQDDKAIAAEREATRLRDQIRENSSHVRERVVRRRVVTR